MIAEPLTPWHWLRDSYAMAYGHPGDRHRDKQGGQDEGAGEVRAEPAPLPVVIPRSHPMFTYRERPGTTPSAA
jgi:hypothetical protein